MVAGRWTHGVWSRVVYVVRVSYYDVAQEHDMVSRLFMNIYGIIIRLWHGTEDKVGFMNQHDSRDSLEEWEDV